MMSFMTQSSRSLRAWKGVAIATLATATALLAHLVAGGAAPGVVGVIVPFTFAVLVSVALAGSAPSLVRTSLAVMASQLLFHALFVLGMGTAGTFLGGSAHGAHSSGVAMSDSVLAQLSHGAALMAPAHLLAAAMTVGAIYAAELLVARRVARAVPVAA